MTTQLRYVNRGLLFITLCFTHLVAEAQSDDASSVNIYSLSLEELLAIEVNVEVASTKAESIIDTPAMVSRYDTIDMERMGLRTLKDILSFFPGFVVQDSKNATQVIVRGISDSFNQKILFLLDGVPYWMPSHGDIPLLGIPIEAIERVEVIRGPGAVIYGTNASAGVISIVTKKQSSNQVTLKLNNNPLSNLSGYYSSEINEDVRYNISFEFQKDEGYDAYFKNTPGGPPSRGFPPGPNDGVISKGNDISSLLVNLKYHNFNLSMQSFQSDFNGPIRYDTILAAGLYEQKGGLFHLNYNGNYKDINFQIFTDYNQFHFHSAAENADTFGSTSQITFTDDGEDTYRARLGGKLNWQLNSDLSALLGAEVEKRSIDDYVIIDDLSDNILTNIIERQDNLEKSLYAQLDYNIGAWRLLVGGRYTQNDNSGNDLTPRISIVRKLNDNSSLKLLHSVGFNSPNFLQSGISLPGTLVSDPTLSAEIATTSEIAYSYNKDTLLFMISGFYTEINGLIAREPTGNGNELEFTNRADTLLRYGFESELQMVLGSWKIYSNFSYLYQGNKDIQKVNDVFAQFSPKYTFYSGFYYQLKDRHSIGSSLRHFSERVNSDAIDQVNLNYNYHAPQYDIFITLSNVLSTTIANGDVGRNRSTTFIPSADPDANVTIGYSYRF